MELDLFSKHVYAEKNVHAGNYDYIYLSPHLDDVALSCSGAIFSQRARGCSVLVATIFAGDPQPPYSASALAFHELWQAPPDAPYRVRKEEDRQAMAALDVDYVWLDWLEVIYRDPSLSDFSDLYNHTANLQHDPVFPRLCGWLTDLCSAYPHAQIVVPLSFGSHHDHRVVFHAALRVLGHTQLLFFEDFPYVAYQPQEEVTESLQQYHLIPLEVDISPYVQQRIAASEIYSSQLPMLCFPPSDFSKVIKEYTATQDGQQRFVERYWRIPR